jgi:hypothetical protein
MQNIQNHLKRKSSVKSKLSFEEVKVQDDHERIAPRTQERLQCSGFY